MSIIPLPNKISYEDRKDNFAKFVVEPLFPGYGTTIGNVIRRVMLSSLNGVAIVSVKITGAEHEFSSIPYVKEDVVELILNFKKIRIKSNIELTEPIKMTLNVTGEKGVVAGDIETPSDIEIANPKQKIATLTDAAGTLEIEFTVNNGRGYSTVEQQTGENKEVGVIVIDSIYSPVVKVGMELENVRVDKMTNFDKLTLEIETDGTRSPEEAVKESIDIIEEHLDFIKSGKDSSEAVVETAEEAETPEVAEVVEEGPKADESQE